MQLRECGQSMKRRLHNNNYHETIKTVIFVDLYKSYESSTPRGP